jgi:hypothetical protein
LAAQVPNTRLVYVADREGDLRELMDASARRGTPADWLVRAKHNRNTTAGDKLWDRLARSEPLGEVELTCVPGMARNYAGESPAARYSQSRRLGKRQGRHREVGSGGSRTQSGGAMNKNRI